MNTNIDMNKLQDDAEKIFTTGFACSESVIVAIRDSFDFNIPDSAIAMSSGFPWGLGGAGCLCGAVAGGAMCIGFLYGRTTPGDPKINRCFELTNEFHDKFKRNSVQHAVVSSSKIILTRIHKNVNVTVSEW